MVDAERYREQGKKTVTTEATGTEFVVRRMSPLRLAELFAEAGVKVEKGVKPEIDPLVAIGIAKQILPECVDDVVGKDEGDATHLEVGELDMDDMMELFTEALTLAGVKDKELATAADFRGEPDGAAGSPDGAGLPGDPPDGDPEASGE